MEVPAINWLSYRFRSACKLNVHLCVVCVCILRTLSLLICIRNSGFVLVEGFAPRDKDELSGFEWTESRKWVRVSCRWSILYEWRIRSWRLFYVWFMMRLNRNSILVLCEVQWLRDLTFVIEKLVYDVVWSIFIIVLFIKLFRCSIYTRSTMETDLFPSRIHFPISPVNQ